MSRKSKAMEFIGEGYNVTVTGRNVLVTDPMKDYAIDKISKLEKFTHRMIDVNVTMDMQKLEHRVEIIMKVNNIKILSRATSNDMYASIDKAVRRIETQLRRYKQRIEEHASKSTSCLDMNVNILRPQRQYELDDMNDEIEEENARRLVDHYRPHEIVAQEKRPLKVLSYDEAVMKLELSNDVFLIFRHEIDNKLKVIYQRNDGNYGIIEPES